MNQKKRILCLHGNFSNSKIFYGQLKQFQQEFKGFEFVTFDGPVLVSPNIIWDEKFAQLVEASNSQNELYAWGSLLKMKSDDNTSGFDEGLSKLIENLKNQGPFFGVMGFSQGSNIVSTLAYKITHKQIDLGYQLQCFIFMSGVPCQAQEGIKQTCRIASLHFIGLNDFLVDRLLLNNIDCFRSIALSQQFLNPFVIYHYQGHRIPSLNFEQIRQIRKFFHLLERSNWTEFAVVPKL